MRVVRLFAGAAVWAVAVLGVAAVGCFVVHSTGRDVGSPENAVTAAPAAVTAPASVAPTSSPPTVDVPPRPAAVPAAVPTPRRTDASPSVSRSSVRTSLRTSPQAASRTSTSQEQWSRPSARSSPGPSAPSPSPSPSLPTLAAASRPAASPSPSSSLVTGSFTFEAGTLFVGCAASTPDAWWWQPAPNWTGDAQLDADGLDVRFVADSGQVIALRVTCPDGAPVFTRR